MAEKKEIRKYIFGRRKEFTQQEAEKCSEKICETLISLPVLNLLLLIFLLIR